MDDATRRFLERRQTGIGGSDVGAICGVSKYRSALDVYLDKVEDVDARYREPNAHMQRGIELEPVARRVFREQTGLDVQKARFRRHPTHHFMVCHPDGIIKPGPGYDKEGKGVLELKCPSLGHFARIKSTGLPEDWLLQMQHNLVVCNLKWGAFGIFNADRWEMLVLIVDRDSTTAEQLVSIERVFWHDYVGTRTPPPQPKQPLVEAPAPDQPDLPNIDRSDNQRFRFAVSNYLAAKELFAASSEVLDGAKADLLGECGDFGVYDCPEATVHYIQHNGRQTFDRKRLEATSPLMRDAVRDIMLRHTELDEQYVGRLLDGCTVMFEDFMKQGKPYPELRVYPTQETTPHE